jgi:hypothetical protein
MSDTAYLVWIIGTALATIIILTTTTLASAGLLRRDRVDRREPGRPVADLRSEAARRDDAHEQDRAA